MIGFVVCVDYHFWAIHFVECAPLGSTSGVMLSYGGNYYAAKGSFAIALDEMRREKAMIA